MKSVERNSPVSDHPVVTREEWLKARKALLAQEKAFTRERDKLTRRCRELPWVKVEKSYVFDGPKGPESLADLFEGRSQLIVYHFMFAPEWSQGCKSCSFLADHYNPAVVHLNHRDVSLVTVSRAPLEKLSAFRERMGWTFKWVSSGGNDFHRDFGVYYSQEELNSGLAVYNYDAKPYPVTDLPGLSVFFRDRGGTVFHTYSTYARGLDILIGTYNLLDLVPKGRDEATVRGMGWVRHHDRYDDPTFVDPWLERTSSAPRSNGAER